MRSGNKICVLYSFNMFDQEGIKNISSAGTIVNGENISACLNFYAVMERKKGPVLRARGCRSGRTG